jgi:D-amino-acid dehydrogenase
MDALVLGGGLVGLNIALQLQARGVAVTLIEAEPTRTAASYGNAGHIAIEQVEPLASRAMVRSAFRRLHAFGGPLDLPLRFAATWLPFGVRLMRAARPDRFAHGKAALSALMREAMPAWRRRVADLGDESLLREDGHFVVWESPQTARTGFAAWQGTDTGEATFAAATPDEIARLSALVRRPVAGAIRFAGTGQVADTARLLRALEDRFVERGGRMVFDRVAALFADKGRAHARLASGDTAIADILVLSAGVASGALLRPLGLKVPIVAERGYHIQSLAPAWPDDLPPVVFEDRSMIVTRFESGLRALSFVEIGRHGASPDRGKWRRLRHHAAELGLPFAADAVEWMGSRPTLPDYLPAIGRVPGVANLYYAFGHQHLGLTLAPVTGEIVAGMIGGGEAPAAFSLDRFQSL